jgi:hypothetical protein
VCPAIGIFPRKSHVHFRKRTFCLEEGDLKVLLHWLEQGDHEDDMEEGDAGFASDELDNEEGGLDMMKMAMDDDPSDLDWLEPAQRKRVQARVPGAPGRCSGSQCLKNSLIVAAQVAGPRSTSRVQMY